MLISVKKSEKNDKFMLCQIYVVSYFVKIVYTYRMIKAKAKAGETTLQSMYNNQNGFCSYSNCLLSTYSSLLQLKVEVNENQLEKKSETCSSIPANN